MVGTGPRQTGTVRDDSRLPLAVGLDVFAVVLFSALGRRTHDASGTFVAVLETAAPFLIGLAVGWLAVRAWARPTAVVTGASVWPIALVVGMLLRRFAWERGTAPAFVVVAALFLGGAFVGWRWLLALTERRAITN